MGIDSKKNNSLLFIPDISGFTRFVSATEIHHSQHIISELLELIIDSNPLDLTVAEVEGDAVMFYKFQHVPTLEEILTQSKQVFLAFHSHLKRYERDRICDCGACTTASKLSLKIIVHAGELTLINVKNHKKPYGPNVILVHRLLKNNVDSDEYLLITDKTFDDFRHDELGIHKEWAQLESGQCNYDNLGAINYKHLSLSPLNDVVPEPEPLLPGKRIKNPIEGEIFIQRSSNDVYRFLSDFNIKSTWVEGLDRMEFDKKKINRQGTKHLCIVDSKELNFETVLTDVDLNNGQRIYGERLTNIPLMKEVLTYYYFTPRDNGTHVRAESHLIPASILGRLLKPLFKLKLRPNINQGLTQLKQFSEKEMQ